MFHQRDQYNPPEIRYVIYCRVSPRGSSYDKENTSVGMQEEVCRAFIARLGGIVLAVYVDDLLTGTNTDRPGLQEILAQLSAGAEWDHLCVYRMDRLTRSLLDQLAICRGFSQANKGIVSATEPNFDYSTSLGKLQMAQLASINEYYRDVVADNTRNKMISIAAAGGWAPGKVPLGYRRAGKRDNRLVIEERGAVKVRDIFEMYVNPKLQMVDISKKYGLNKQQVLWILRNRVYIGKIVYSGQEFEGMHEPIIPLELFEKAQRNRQEPQFKRRPKAEKRKYLLTGLVRCHCGRYMSPSSAKSGQYHYYLCTDTVHCKSRVSAAALEEKVKAELRRNSMPPEARARILAECERRRLAYVATATPEMEALETARRKAVADREKLFNILLDLRGSEAKFINSKLEALSSEIETIDGQLEQYRGLKNSKTMVFDEMTRLVDTIANLSRLLADNPDDFDVQRQLLIANVEKIQNEPDGAFRIFYNWSSANRQVWHPQWESNPCCRDENPVS